MLAPHRLAPATTAIKQRALPTGWISACFVLCLMVTGIAQALAINGTWIDTTSGGLWSTTTNWSGGTVANGTDGIADFSTLNITADDTIHLDSARTIGQLKFGDTVPSNNWILDNNGNAADILTLAVTSGSPTITVNNDIATISAVLAGTQGLTFAGSGTLVLTGNDTFTGGLTVSNGTLSIATINNAGTSGTLGNNTSVTIGTISVPGTLEYTGGTAASTMPFTMAGFTSAGGGVFQVDSSGTNLTLSGAIGGGGALTKTGAGTLTLSGNNTFAAGSMLNAGILVIGNNDALGTGTLTASGGTLQADGNGPYNVMNPVSLAGALTISGNNNFTLGGQISGGGSLIKSGASTLILGGANAFTGGVRIISGTLDVTNAGALNSVAPNKVTFLQPSANAILQLDVPGGLIAVGGLDADPSLSSTPVVQPAPGLQAFTALRINNTGTDTFAGNLIAQPIDNGFRIDKIGPGTQIFSGSNNFDTLTIGGGNIQLASATALPNSATVGFDPGSTGSLTLAGFNVTVSSIFNDPNVGSPAIQNASSTPANLALNDLGFDNEFDGALSDGIGGGALSLTKLGSGTFYLGGNNTFTGGVTINAGTLRVFNAGALNSTSPNSVTFGPNSTGTLALGGFSVTISGLNSDAAVGTPTVQNGSATPATLTLNIGGTSNVFAGVIQDGPGGGPLSLTKTGTGSITLSGNNTFTGNLTILGGGVAQIGGLVSNVVNAAAFVYDSGSFAGRLTNAGIVAFNADFTAGNGIENDSSLAIATGRTITLNGAGLDNEGSLTLAGGSLILSTSPAAANVNRGTFNLSSTKPFSLTGATLTNAGTLNLNGGLFSGPGLLANNPGGVIVGSGTVESAFVNNAGGTLIAGAGTTNMNLPFINNGLIQLATVNSDVVGAAITNSATGTIQGVGVVGNAVTNNGTIEAVDGTLSVDGLLSNAAGGILTADTASKMVIGGGLATNAGIINLTGGTFDNGGQPLKNIGQISGWGVFRTGGTGMDNNGSITFSGGVTTVNGPVTNEAGRTITVAQNNAIFTGLVTNNANATFDAVNAVATFAGGFVNNGNSNFVKAGGGIVEVDAAPTLNNGSTLSVTSGTLRFSIVTGAPTIGTGVTAVISAGATLELSGSVSALANGPNRVNIINDSNAPGVLVTGTDQQVGNIDGSGTTQVNAGNDLTANHIIQSALVIGGTSKNPGLVTIAASDAAGNPLDSFLLTAATTSERPIPNGASSINTVSGNLNASSSAPLVSSTAAQQSSVPEPSSLILLVVGCLAVGGVSVGWRGCGHRAVKDFSYSARSPT